MLILNPVAHRALIDCTLKSKHLLKKLMPLDKPLKTEVQILKSTLTSKGNCSRSALRAVIRTRKSFRVFSTSTHVDLIEFALYVIVRIRITGSLSKPPRALV